MMPRYKDFTRRKAACGWEQRGKYALRWAIIDVNLLGSSLAHFFLLRGTGVDAIGAMSKHIFTQRFRIRWAEASTDCGGWVRLTTESPESAISSPGYPHEAPQHGVECLWRAQGPPGTRIRVDFPDRFHMRNG